MWDFDSHLDYISHIIKSPKNPNNFEPETDDDDDGLEEMGKDGKQLLLHNLKDITLFYLPNFQEIHHGFKLKEDVNQTIVECPKYSPSLYLHPGKIHMPFF